MDFGAMDFKNDLIMNLQHHSRTVIAEILMETNHSQLNNVSTAALDKMVDGHKLFILFDM